MKTQQTDIGYNRPISAQRSLDEAWQRAYDKRGEKYANDIFPGGKMVKTIALEDGTILHPEQGKSITPDEDTPTQAQPIYKTRLANGLKLTSAMELECQRDEYRAHAQRLADALVQISDWALQNYEPNVRRIATEALAQWENSNEK